MRNTLFALMITSALAVGACGNSDLNASIEAMNEGVQLVQNGSYSAGIEMLKKAGTLHEDNHFAWYNLGQVHVQRKEWEDAVDAFQRATKVNDQDAMYQYHLGHSLLETDDVDQAQVHLEQAVKLNERLYKAHFFLGKVYELQGKPKDASHAWTKSAELNPFFGKPFISLGSMYLTWDMAAQAISVLDQGSLNVKDGGELSNIYYHLGLAYDAQKQYQKAVESYDKALSTKRDNADALRQRGFAYAELGDLGKATKDLEDFVQQGGGGDAFDIQAANDRLMRLRMEAAQAQP